MNGTTRLAAGSRFPVLTWDTPDGRSVDPALGPGWKLLVVYRGKHCPLCRQYLVQLNQLADKFAEANIQVLALSSDPVERARAWVDELQLTFPVGYGLTVEQMRQLGLYISAPRSPEETDRPFAEPGIFAINPEGLLQIVDISNAPFVRPDLAGLLSGLRFIQKHNYPIRGTFS